MNNGSAAINELREEWQQLFAVWQKTTASWHDSVQQDFDATHVQHVADEVATFERALVNCADVLNQAWSQAP